MKLFKKDHYDRLFNQKESTIEKQVLAYQNMGRLLCPNPRQFVNIQCILCNYPMFDYLDCKNTKCNAFNKD